MKDGASNKLDRLFNLQPDMPVMVMEWWTGWFDYWGIEHQTWAPESFGEELKAILGELFSLRGQFKTVLPFEKLSRFCQTTKNVSLWLPHAVGRLKLLWSSLVLPCFSLFVYLINSEYGEFGGHVNYYMYHGAGFVNDFNSIAFDL